MLNHYSLNRDWNHCWKRNSSLRIFIQKSKKYIQSSLVTSLSSPYVSKVKYDLSITVLKDPFRLSEMILFYRTCLWSSQGAIIRPLTLLSYLSLGKSLKVSALSTVNPKLFFILLSYDRCSVDTPLLNNFFMKLHLLLCFTSGMC